MAAGDRKHTGLFGDRRIEVRLLPKDAHSPVRISVVGPFQSTDYRERPLAEPEAEILWELLGEVLNKKLK